MMTEIQCEPEQFTGRIIFMSKYNDIVWGEKRKLQNPSHPQYALSWRSFMWLLLFQHVIHHLVLDLLLYCWIETFSLLSLSCCGGNERGHVRAGFLECVHRRLRLKINLQCSVSCDASMLDLTNMLLMLSLVPLCVFVRICLRGFCWSGVSSHQSSCSTEPHTVLAHLASVGLVDSSFSLSLLVSVHKTRAIPCGPKPIRTISGF